MGELHAVGGERDWKLVARKARTAILHDAKIAEGRPVDHLVPENDRAIDHELQKAVAMVVGSTGFGNLDWHPLPPESVAAISMHDLSMTVLPLVSG